MPSPRSQQGIVELDGRTLEGGGQLVRMAVGLSALTGTPIRITNIRANRTKGGGLKAQHLAGVRWLAHACNAYTEGAEQGSKTLLFQPNLIPGQLSPAFTKKTLPDQSQVYEAHLNIGTVGATSLALQAILPFVLFTQFPSRLPIHLTLTGGTNVTSSPSYDYVSQVLLPTLHKIGLPKTTATLAARGWFGGRPVLGSFSITIPARESTVLPAFHYSPIKDSPSPATKPALQLTLISHQSLSAEAATLLPIDHASFDSITTTTEQTNIPKQTYLLAVATYPTHILATDHLSISNTPPRDSPRHMSMLIDKVLSDLQREMDSEAWVDAHMRDQLVIYAALAEGTSTIYFGEDREVSLHTRTAEWVAKKMLPGVRFNAEGQCEGIGFSADNIEEALEKLDLG